MGKAWTADKIRKARKPMVGKAEILLDPELDLELQRLERELLRAKAEKPSTLDGPHPDVITLTEQIEELGKQAEECTVEFVFHGIGRRAWFDLIKEHPPAKDHKGSRWNIDTFPAAALAASCVSPEGLDLEWWSQTLEEWDTGQIVPAWEACLEANEGEAGEGKKALRLASEVRSSIATSSQPRSE